MSTFERRIRGGTQTAELTELVPLDQLAPAFVEAFRHASERRLLTLYDDVADSLRSRFPALETAGEAQLDVLARVAELVGLEGVDLDAPLADPQDEALAERIAWRETASWATLSLLWSLTERAPGALGAGEWAQAAFAGKKPRGGSLLPEDDDEQALVFAAEALSGSAPLDAGCALVVRGSAYVVTASDQGVSAQPVVPTALVASRGEINENEIELEAGDQVWIAQAGDDDSDSVRRYPTAERLALGGSICAASVVAGVTLLYERDSRE